VNQTREVKYANIKVPLCYVVHKEMASLENISHEKKEVIRNLYLSGISEEFIAMQLDTEIPVVIQVLKELGVYKSS
jgi:hypothetical protein